MSPKRQDDEPLGPGQQPPSEGIFHHIRRITDLENRVNEIERQRPTEENPPVASDSYTKAETDAKLDALGSRFDLAVEKMENRISGHIDKLVKSELEPIKLDHAGLKKDMDWNRSLLTSIVASVIVALLLGMISFFWTVSHLPTIK